MGHKWSRTLLIGLSFVLVASGLVGMVLSGSTLGNDTFLVQDVSTSVSGTVAQSFDFGFSWSNGTTPIGLQALYPSAGIGTLILIPNLPMDGILGGSIFVVIGTVSIDRREHQRLQKLRDRVLDEIAANPGIHLRELHRIVGCAMGALQYHLNVLERLGLVVSARTGNARHLFLAGYSTDENILRLASISRNPTVQAILGECMGNGRTTQAELSRKLSLDKSLISYYVTSLIKHDILQTIKVFGRERPVILTDWARASLDALNLIVH
ncbi:MAG: winged helix-turn-helix transcriptional regulator [Candidatus Hodarchaeota archaeon]